MSVLYSIMSLYYSIIIIYCLITVKTTMYNHNSTNVGIRAGNCLCRSMIKNGIQISYFSQTRLQ